MKALCTMTVYILMLFIAAPCDEGTVYNDCGSPCPATCQHPDGAPDCPLDCVEVCECPEGQILDGADCVFPYNCGCTLSNGVYIPVSIHI